MADKRSIFRILLDSAGEAFAPTKVLEGDPTSGNVAIDALVGKDPSNNLAHIPITSDNRVAVSQEGELICHCDYGLTAGNLAFQTVATITLSTSTTYRDLSWVFSCFRDAEFQVIHNDNATETTLASVLTAAGDVTDSGKLHCFKFTSGATGTQELLVKAKNFNATSDFRAAISINEVA